MAAFASQQPIDGLADTSYYQEELDRIRRRGNSVAQNTTQGVGEGDNMIGDFLDFYNKQKSPIYDGKGNQVGFNHGYGVEERWDPQQPGDDKWISDEEWERLSNEPSPPPDQRWPGDDRGDVDVPQPIDQPGIGMPTPIGRDKSGPRIKRPKGGRGDYGSRIGVNFPPGSGFTMDWRDSDGDGVDDRWQSGPGEPSQQGKIKPGRGRGPNGDLSWDSDFITPDRGRGPGRGGSDFVKPWENEGGSNVGIEPGIDEIVGALPDQGRGNLEDRIRGMYQNLLGREADQEGLDYWVNEAINNPDPWNEEDGRVGPNKYKKALEGIRNNIKQSDEYRQRPPVIRDRDTVIGPPPGGWENEQMPPGWGGSGTPPRRGESMEDYNRRMQEIQDKWDNQRREENEGRRPPRRRGKDTWGPGEEMPPVRPGLPRPPEPGPRPPIPGPRPPKPGPRPSDPWPDGDGRPYPMPGPPDWEGCPTPDQQILLADKSLIFAGELQVGDKVHTMHETTFESGDYEVTHVSFHEQPVYLVKFSDDHEIRCSASHKLYSEDKEAWVSIKELGSGERVSLYDGEVAFISAEYTGDEKVVKITVEDAHTYICEGLFSHNKTLIPKPPIEEKPPIHGDPIGPKRPEDEAAIAGMYNDYLGRDADREGFQYWLDQVRSGNQSLDQVAANIKASPESEDYRSKTPQRPTPVPSGVGDEDYRAVSIRYAEGHEPSEEEHRVNQKKFWEQTKEPLTRFGEKRNEERGRLESSIPSRPVERKEEAQERSRQWQQDRGPIQREERAPKPNIGRDPERRPAPSRPETEGRPARPETEGRPATPPRKPPERDWLEAAYQDNLGRSADKGGKDYWAKEVSSGRQTKEQVIDNIRRSDEYKSRSR